MPSYAKTFLKLALVVFLFYFLFSKGLLSLERTRSALDHPDLVWTGVLIICSASFLGAWRWQMLLDAHGIVLGYWQTMQLTMIGAFFNIALPGAVSGDLIKAFYIGRKVEGARANAFGSIVFDRIIGTSALGLVSGGALLYDYDSFEGHALMTGVKTIVVMATVFIVAFYSYLFLLKENHDPLLKAFKKLEARWEKFGSVTRIYLGVRHYHSHREIVFKTLLISIVIHLMIGYACGRFALALGAGNFSLSALYVVVPLGLLVTAIPVAPAGVGTGHVAFATLFSLLGSSLGADIFSFIAITNFLIGGVGGLIYLRYKAEVTSPAEALTR